MSLARQRPALDDHAHFQRHVVEPDAGHVLVTAGEQLARKFVRAVTAGLQKIHPPTKPRGCFLAALFRPPPFRPGRRAPESPAPPNPCRRTARPNRLSRPATDAPWARAGHFFRYRAVRRRWHPASGAPGRYPTVPPA